MYTDCKSVNTQQLALSITIESKTNLFQDPIFFFSPILLRRVLCQPDYTSLGEHELQRVQYLQEWLRTNKLLRVGKCEWAYVMLLEMRTDAALPRRVLLSRNNAAWRSKAWEVMITQQGERSMQPSMFKMDCFLSARISVWYMKHAEICFTRWSIIYDLIANCVSLVPL